MSLRANFNLKFRLITAFCSVNVFAFLLPILFLMFSKDMLVFCVSTSNKLYNTGKGTLTTGSILIRSIPPTVKMTFSAKNLTHDTRALL